MAHILNMRRKYQFLCFIVHTLLFFYQCSCFLLLQQSRIQTSHIILYDKLGIEDLFNENDLKIIRERFIGLNKVFPRIKELDLRDIVTSSPLFLTMETDKFINALKQLQEVYPYIDSSYLISQKSPGLQLLLLIMSGNFNFIERQMDVQRVISNSKFSCDEVIQRIPHILIPRYTLLLNDQLFAFKKHFPFIDDRVSMGIVMKWPKILSIDLTANIKKLTEVFQSMNIKLNNKELFLVIKNSPQVLLVDFVVKRLQFLMSNYPKLLLKDVIIEYPKVLIWPGSAFANHYEVCAFISCNIHHLLNIDVLV